jgi:hypothetical protein
MLWRNGASANIDISATQPEKLTNAGRDKREQLGTAQTELTG